MQDPVHVLPDGAHNRALVATVHPPDWVNPEPQDRYNLVVVGAGTAGLITSLGASSLGARVALVERHLMGGDCLHADAAHAAREAPLRRLAAAHAVGLRRCS